MDEISPNEACAGYSHRKLSSVAARDEEGLIIFAKVQEL